MFLHINEVNYLGEYRLRLWFNDGQIKDVDFKRSVHGEVFEPLKNLELFQQVLSGRGYRDGCVAPGR